MDPLLQQLQNEGVDLDAPRVIEHHIVGSIPILSGLVRPFLHEKLEKLGFTVHALDSFIQASETISPNEAALKKNDMRSLCAQHLHSYDGWGTSVDVKSAADENVDLKTEDPLVVRTDFSNNETWEKIKEAILRPVGEAQLRAYVEFLDDEAYSGLGKTDFLDLPQKGYAHTFLILVDSEAINRTDQAVLVIDLDQEPGREFRAIPSQIQSIENNLNIANMDFDEFADEADETGTFCGFREI